MEALEFDLAKNVAETILSRFVPDKIVGATVEN